MAGSATDWYWGTEQTKCSSSLGRMVSRHWGSVVAGSFMNGFFEVPTLFMELVTCHPRTCCNKAGVMCEQKCCCGKFFNLVRTDAYSYINLAGLPFCNAARQSFEVCHYAQNEFVAGYNPMKHYRFVASTALTTLLYILGSIYVNKRVVNFYWWENVVLIVISYAVICWFVDISANAAEGVSTSYLAEHYLFQGYENMRYCQQVYHLLLSNIKSKFKRDLTVTIRHMMATFDSDLHRKIIIHLLTKTFIKFIIKLISRYRSKIKQSWFQVEWLVSLNLQWLSNLVELIVSYVQ